MKDEKKFARVLERREARARRSKRLGRFIFSGFGIFLMITLRMNPAIADDIAGFIVGLSEDGQTVQTSEQASNMPKNRVKVRKGIIRTQQASTQNGQALAQEIDNTLSTRKVGQ